MEPKVFCEYQDALIKCPNGRIQVEHAFFGRKDNITCRSSNGILSSGYICETNNSTLDKVHEKCEGQRSCEIYVSSYMFDDPCPGIQKYLNITYECSTENGNL